MHTNTSMMSVSTQTNQQTEWLKNCCFLVYKGQDISLSHNVALEWAVRPTSLSNGYGGRTAIKQSCPLYSICMECLRLHEAHLHSSLKMWCSITHCDNYTLHFVPISFTQQLFLKEICNVHITKHCGVFV
jgi:hypothetical protein